MAYTLIPRITHVDPNDSIEELRRRISILFDRLMEVNIVTATATITASCVQNVLLCNATTGAITVNLPDARMHKNHMIIVKKTDASANAVTLDGFSTQTIDGGLTLALAAQYNFRIIISDGSNWHVVSS